MSAISIPVLHQAPRLRAMSVAALALLVLTACAPVTRVTLLPQFNSQRSAVVVTSAKGQQIITQAYGVAEIQKDGTLKPTRTTADEVAKTHPQLIGMQPSPPETFVLEFEPGTSDLTAASQLSLPEVIAKAQGRAGGEIVVTGHTDRLGKLEANDALSLSRAEALRELLISKGFKAELIQAVGRGERDPLVATEDEVAEPRNRRAVIVVR